MGVLRIRPYTDADWPAVRDVYDAAKPDEMRGAVDLAAVVPIEQDPASLALFRSSRILVAADGERVVGFAGHRGNYVSWMFVHPDARRRGIGRALLAAVLEPLRGPVTLNVLPGNLPARALYERSGFVAAREFDAVFNGRPVRVMTLVRG